MFKENQKVKLKYPEPGEADLIFIIKNVNNTTYRVLIQEADSALPLPPQEIVHFNDITLI